MLENGLRIGWASKDLTPEEPVLLTGQFYARVSEGVRDPITATAMAFESVRDGESVGRGVMVSCDLVSIADSLRDAVRAHVTRDLPELEPEAVFLNATHTHTGPAVRLPADSGGTASGNLPEGLERELGVMPVADYADLAARRIAAAVVEAWRDRRAGGIGFGLAHAVVGYNRRMTYYSGETRMRGNPDDPEFSHIEGGADSTVNTVFTWDRANKLTGVIVNVACPSQVSEHEFQLSADYWHETRQELRRQLGDHVFILPQNSASGDLCPGHPRTMIEWRGQERMWRLMGIDQRRAIGQRLAGAVASVLPYAQREVEWHPSVVHRSATVELTRRMLSAQDVQDADADAAKLREEFEAVQRELEADPAKRREPRWYIPLTRAYGRMNWNQRVAARYEAQNTQPTLPVEVHVVRLGDVAIATNPFEYYLDFGHQIKARSKAVQTLLVQHVGNGTYLPTARATAGKSYGAVPASTPVGPEGGRELVNWTVEAINDLFAEPASTSVA